MCSLRQSVKRSPPGKKQLDQYLKSLTRTRTQELEGMIIKAKGDVVVRTVCLICVDKLIQGLNERWGYAFGINCLEDGITTSK
ncbi:hypothetical protein Hdeb2414_s0014g00424361 [Helianthus debilis subsp. tardiflorus]